ncbi:MAG TPA: DUF6569 family protein [Terriglobales bacterium]|nr:DUF6569 family protein [Terriglobales bacterium]
MSRRTLAVVITSVSVAVLLLLCNPVFAGRDSSSYRVLEPIRHGSLTIFPVVVSEVQDTSGFITLDEGLRSGEVVVTEAGRVEPMMRRRRVPVPVPRSDGAEVNRLVLVNNSDRPLILLAGEIVTGGKQDRVIGKDRIVPANSDPVDLSVFCVEPGRWTRTSENFAGFKQLMAQPSVRRKAMADKDQQGVWNGVRESAAKMAAAAPAAVSTVEQTSSYAGVMRNEAVQEQVDSVAAPILASFEGVRRELKDRRAVGVVVAVNGRIIWADIFASSSLLDKYWPKLARSYAAEAITLPAVYPELGKVNVASAQEYLSDLRGGREVVETEPGVFRHVEISAADFKVFELTSLLRKTGFAVHIAKMSADPEERGTMLIR